MSATGLTDLFPITERRTGLSGGTKGSETSPELSSAVIWNSLLRSSTDGLFFMAGVDCGQVSRSKGLLSSEGEDGSCEAISWVGHVLGIELSENSEESSAARFCVGDCMSWVSLE